MGAQKIMGFTRFVEMGRVVLVNYGPNEGTLGMITDVIDQNRCMVYSPSFDRKEMTYKRLSLTDLKVRSSAEHALRQLRQHGLELTLRASGATQAGLRRGRHRRGRLPCLTWSVTRQWSQRRSKLIPNGK